MAADMGSNRGSPDFIMYSGLRGLGRAAAKRHPQLFAAKSQKLGMAEQSISSVRASKAARSFSSLNVSKAHYG